MLREPISPVLHKILTDVANELSEEYLRSGEVPSSAFVSNSTLDAVRLALGDVIPKSDDITRHLSINVTQMPLVPGEEDVSVGNLCLDITPVSETGRMLYKMLTGKVEVV